MKIITWNINGYRAIAGQNASKRFDKVTKENKLFSYIETEKPDIICLQETKADENQINEDIRYPEDYFGYYHSCRVKKGYSGVVTFSKIKPKSVNYEIGVERFDYEGRIVELDFDDFVILNIYFPKGYTDHERLDFKLDFYDKIIDYTGKLLKKGKSVIVSGDYNTAHTEIDLARPDENTKTSGFLIEEREKLDIMLKMGFIDTFREMNNEAGHYTWWSQRSRARENNIGWRIDYHFISNSLGKYLKSSIQQPNVLGSDHCPVVIELEL